MWIKKLSGVVAGKDSGAARGFCKHKAPIVGRISDRLDNCAEAGARDWRRYWKGQACIKVRVIRLPSLRGLI